MVCRCEPLHSSGYGHMADRIRPEPAVHRTAGSPDCHDQFASVKGALSSRRRAPFAVQYRLVDEHQRPRGKRRCRAGRRAERSTSDAGQDGVEIQPRIDWDKGRAVLCLLDALGLDEEDVLPL